MKKKKTSTQRADASPEEFFIARKGLGKEVSVRYSVAALKVLDVQKEQGTGTKNQFISDAIVEYGLAQYGVKKLGEEFAKYKTQVFAKTEDLILKEVVTALAVTLFDGTFNKMFKRLCEKITEDDIDKLKGQTAKEICKSLAQEHQFCTRRKPLWALAFWAVKKGWFEQNND